MVWGGGGGGGCGGDVCVCVCGGGGGEAAEGVSIKGPKTVHGRIGQLSVVTFALTYIV